jgi:hypothetical protein
MSDREIVFVKCKRCGELAKRHLCLKCYERDYTASNKATKLATLKDCLKWARISDKEIRLEMFRRQIKEVEK